MKILAVTIWLGSLLLSLAATVAFFWVCFHFAAKYW